MPQLTTATTPPALRAGLHGPMGAVRMGRRALPGVRARVHLQPPPVTAGSPPGQQGHRALPAMTGWPGPAARSPRVRVRAAARCHPSPHAGAGPGGVWSRLGDRILPGWRCPRVACRHRRDADGCRVHPPPSAAAHPVRSTLPTLTSTPARRLMLPRSGAARALSTQAWKPETSVTRGSAFITSTASCSRLRPQEARKRRSSASLAGGGARLGCGRAFASGPPWTRTRREV